MVRRAEQEAHPGVRYPPPREPEHLREGASIHGLILLWRLPSRSGNPQFSRRTHGKEGESSFERASAGSPLTLSQHWAILSLWRS